jgi:hypothetical protein
MKNLKPTSVMMGQSDPTATCAPSIGSPVTLKEKRWHGQCDLRKKLYKIPTWSWVYGSTTSSCWQVMAKTRVTEGVLKSHLMCNRLSPPCGPLAPSLIHLWALECCVFWLQLGEKQKEAAKGAHGFSHTVSPTRFICRRKWAEVVILWSSWLIEKNPKVY